MTKLSRPLSRTRGRLFPHVRPVSPLTNKLLDINMFHKLFAFALLALATAQGLLIENTQEFLLGSAVENLVIRPSGLALATVYTYPHLYQVPVANNSVPELVHTFHNATGACGIAASGTEADVYYVLTGNYSFETFSPVPGSYAVHRVSFASCSTPVVRHSAPLDDIAQPNGIIAVPDTPYVLITDSRGGYIYRFNTETFLLDQYFKHPMLDPVASDLGILSGANGVKMFGGYLYFSNTNQQVVARIPATGKEASLQGDPEVVATQTQVDDFIIDEITGDLYTVESGDVNGIGRVRWADYGSKPDIIAGGPNSGALLAPTAAAWAKDAVGKTLVVSVTGGFEQFQTKEYTGGHKLSIVHLE